MWSGYKDGISTDPIHVDTRASLYVVKMNVAILCDQVYNVILRANLEIKWNIRIQCCFKCNNVVEQKWPVGVQINCQPCFTHNVGLENLIHNWIK